MEWAACRLIDKQSCILLTSGTYIRAQTQSLSSMDKNAMWIEKYRPQSLDDVAAHKEIIETSKCC